MSPLVNRRTDSPGFGRKRRARRAEPKLKSGVRRRLLIVCLALFGMLGGIGYRAYSMQMVNADRYRSLADRQHLRSLEVPAPRGAIYDRKGVALAVTADADSVWANPRNVLDISGTAEALAPILDLERSAIMSRLESDRYFVWIARHLTTDQTNAIKKLEIPGVSLISEPRRFYPGRGLAGPVIGFADIDGRGLDGIELSMNDLLAGRRGQVNGIRDAGGKLMLPNSKADALAGSSLVLTFDRTVQFIAEQAIIRAINEHKASAGVAIVLEVGTGDVLAMASVPTKDPNQPGSAPATARNRAINDAYEVGSVMKVFSVAAALEAGVVKPTTEFDVFGGKMRLGRKMIHDSFRDDVLTVSGIIKRSSNVGMIQIARLLGRDKLHEALTRYRFGKRTGIELQGERSGILRPARRWGSTDLAVISYGYGMTATPLQTVAAISAIGSGGIYYAPRLVREVRAPDGEASFVRKPVGTRIMKAKTASEMMAMMARVFDKGHEGGTARTVDLLGFSAVGKTGTARKIDPATGAYGKLYLSSMAGLAPKNDPKIAIFVMVDEPTSGHYYGGTVVGPAFAEITSKTLKVLGIAPDGEPMVADAAAADVVTPSEPMFAEVNEEDTTPPRIHQPGDIEMPEFRGMTIREAMRKAAESDLEIEIRGSGRAISQSIAAGPIAPSSLCVVTFASSVAIAR